MPLIDNEDIDDLELEYAYQFKRINNNGKRKFPTCGICGCSLYSIRDTIRHNKNHMRTLGEQYL